MKDADVETAPAKQAAPVIDIEHVEVLDDPRKWPARRKWAQFLFIGYSAMAAAMTANIFFPAIDDLKRDLGASQQVINLSVSLFIFFQGTVPILWSAVSEIYGRKIVYIVAFCIFTIAQIVCGVAKNQILFLVFRVVGAVGSSVGLTIGGGSLADMYDPHERGTKIGIYYMFPLLGPSIGTLLGGALTLSKPGWRTAFYFMASYGATCTIWACLVKDTFRKERSIAWVKAYKRAQKAAKAKDDERRNGQPHEHPKGQRLWLRSHGTAGIGSDEASESTQKEASAEAASTAGFTGGRPLLRKITTETGEEVPVKVHLADINPLAASGTVMRQPANALAIVASGLLFAGQYSLTYTGALSFAAPPYSYNSLNVGLILLCFGIGNIVGSLLGGRMSDIMLAKSKQQNNGQAIPEWRLRATLAAMPLIPASFIAYAWTVDKAVPIYGPCIVLFMAGFSSIWLYSCTLSYIVDSSVGMASSAVSCNSAARGIFAFIASQTAQPLLKSIGNGWLYTMWTFIQMAALAMILTVCFKGHSWRSRHKQLRGPDISAIS